MLLALSAGTDPRLLALLVPAAVVGGQVSLYFVRRWVLMAAWPAPLTPSVAFPRYTRVSNKMPRKQ